MITLSPLRYPGGKAAFAGLLSEIFDANGLVPSCFVEPYAGGAGAAMRLLFEERVERILINDADPAMSLMWTSILTKTDEFIEKLLSVQLTLGEWRRQQEIYRDPSALSFDRGFATFYLNRTNRSGIIRGGGPIGGVAQRSKWGIDARFNRRALAFRIEQIAKYADRIEVTNDDGLDTIVMAAELCSRDRFRDKIFFFIDPPYVGKGDLLYYNNMEEDDHEELSRYLLGQCPWPWVVTYDDCELIRDLYSDCVVCDVGVTYSACERGVGRELLIAHPSLRMPGHQQSCRIKI
jgi:DNA adenine methylase